MRPGWSSTPDGVPGGRCSDLARSWYGSDSGMGSYPMFRETSVPHRSSLGTGRDSGPVPTRDTPVEVSTRPRRVSVVPLLGHEEGVLGRGGCLSSLSNHTFDLPVPGRPLAYEWTRGGTSSFEELLHSRPTGPGRLQRYSVPTRPSRVVVPRPSRPTGKVL